MKRLYSFHEDVTKQNKQQLSITKRFPHCVYYMFEIQNTTNVVNVKEGEAKTSDFLFFLQY